jgi:twitching motility protein PilT
LAEEESSLERSSQLKVWLETLLEKSGSDLYLVEGLPPTIRSGSQLLKISDESLEGESIEAAILPVLRPSLAQSFRSGTTSIDASLHFRPLGRFRINLHRERGRAAATIRAVPGHLPRLLDLGLPPSIEGLSRLPHGLVLIGGPTGSGKTTTLAALIDEINRRDSKHIITIEDPIEYEHPHIKSVVEQIEIGVDAPDFPTALRSALRQSPDIIVVGEMRDPETMRIAVTAGETGHLVFSTLHTNDVTSTVSRVSDSFPLERQNTIRNELSMALAAVMTQKLLPRVGGGRVPAAELLMMSYGARQHIRKNTLQHLHQEISMTRNLGSFTFEESLAGLVKAGRIEPDQARGRTVHSEELDTLLRGIGGRS